MRKFPSLASFFFAFFFVCVFCFMMLLLLISRSFVYFIFTCYVNALFPSAVRSVTAGKAAAARWQRSPGHGGAGREGKAAGLRGGSSSEVG